MHFYLNEYSLNGQFSNKEEFIDTLGEVTLPLFNEIKTFFKDECLIYKSQLLWKRPICNSVSLNDILNLSSKIPQLRKFKQLLYDLCYNEPYFPDADCLKNIHYEFPFDESEDLSSPNCFVLAALDESDIFSFQNSMYKKEELQLHIDGKEYVLFNIFDNKSLENYKTKYKFNSSSPRTRWYIDKYRLEIRTKEHNCNKPHVHIVVEGEYDISYSLEDISILEKKPSSVSNNEYTIHIDLISEHKTTLTDTWNYYHPDRIVKQLIGAT